MSVIQELQYPQLAVERSAIVGVGNRPEEAATVGQRSAIAGIVDHRCGSVGDGVGEGQAEGQADGQNHVLEHGDGGGG